MEKCTHHITHPHTSCREQWVEEEGVRRMVDEHVSTCHLLPLATSFSLTSPPSCSPPLLLQPARRPCSVCDIVDLGVGNAYKLVYCTSQPESLSQYACKHAVARTQASRGGRWWDGVGDMEEVVEYRGGILSQSPRSCSCIPMRHLGLTQGIERVPGGIKRR